MNVSRITKQQREKTNGHKAFVIWLTGLSGSGKSTIAHLAEQYLFDRNMQVRILDGDDVRSGINSDLDFSKTGRAENIRRVAEVANLFCRSGMIVIVALISPYEADRQNARAIIGQDNFFEVFVDASLDCCRRRDVKGLYQKADAGAISNFTGVSDIYEPPARPDLCLDTEQATPETSIDQLLSALTERKYL